MRVCLVVPWRQFAQWLTGAMQTSPIIIAFRRHELSRDLRRPTAAHEMESDRESITWTEMGQVIVAEELGRLCGGMLRWNHGEKAVDRADSAEGLRVVESLALERSIYLLCPQRVI